jgi:hypothetical protein
VLTQFFFFSAWGPTPSELRRVVLLPGFFAFPQGISIKNPPLCGFIAPSFQFKLLLRVAFSAYKSPFCENWSFYEKVCVSFSEPLHFLFRRFPCADVFAPLSLQRFRRFLPDQPSSFPLEQDYLPFLAQK